MRINATSYSQVYWVSGSGLSKTTNRNTDEKFWRYNNCLLKNHLDVDKKIAQVIKYYSDLNNTVDATKNNVGRN